MFFMRCVAKMGARSAPGVVSATSLLRHSMLVSPSSSPRVALLHTRTLMSRRHEQRAAAFATIPFSPANADPSNSPDGNQQSSAPPPSSSSSHDQNNDPFHKTGSKKKGKTGLAEYIRRYGVVAFVTYGSVYFSTLGAMYVCVHQNLIVALDANDLIQKVPLLADLLPDDAKISPLMGDFGLAWILTKFTEPLRLVFTASVTPFLARQLTSRAPALAKLLRVQDQPSKTEESSEDGEDKKNQ